MDSLNKIEAVAGGPMTVLSRVFNFDIGTTMNEYTLFKDDTLYYHLFFVESTYYKHFQTLSTFPLPQSKKAKKVCLKIDLMKIVPLLGRNTK